MRRSQRRNDEDREAQKRHLVESLAIYEALVLAMERSHEILSLVETAADPDDAVAGVRRLLGVSHIQAIAVLDAQLRRFTLRDRGRITDERDRLRALAKTSPDEAV
jgi:DNA gyrase/topoisomerase IV subunit A